MIALSTSLLGTGLGSINLGTLWLCYVLTAMFFATAIIQALGAKGGLLFGTLGYCIYVGSFLLAATVAPDGPVFASEDAAAQQSACEAISATNTSGTYPCTYAFAAGETAATCKCVGCPETYSPFVLVGTSLCATDTSKAISLVRGALSQCRAVQHFGSCLLQCTAHGRSSPSIHPPAAKLPTHSKPGSGRDRHPVQPALSLASSLTRRIGGWVLDVARSGPEWVALLPASSGPRRAHTLPATQLSSPRQARRHRPFFVRTWPLVWHCDPGVTRLYSHRDWIALVNNIWGNFSEHFPICFWGPALQFAHFLAKSESTLATFHSESRRGELGWPTRKRRPRCPPTLCCLRNARRGVATDIIQAGG